MESNGLYSTTDLFSASIIRASGIPLIDMVKSNRDSVSFVFKDDERICTRLIQSHWDRKLKLQTRLLFETLKELRTRVHDHVVQP
jgi:hypothetical protein